MNFLNQNVTRVPSRGKQKRSTWNMEQKQWLGQIREKTQKLISLESVVKIENTVGNMETVSVPFTMPTEN